MPIWAKYDRANGRIVHVEEAAVAPAEDRLVAVIEVGSGARVGDFIGAPDDPSTNPQPKE
jgi:hypothetical protein